MPVAIVTGASLGLGRALSLALARDGWDLVVDARHEGPLRVAAETIRSAGGSVSAIAGDVTDAVHRKALVAAAAEHGRLDLLVNNASTLGPVPMPAVADYPPEELLKVYDVNVVAPVGLTQLALPLLTRSAGRVVNITSDASVEAYEGWGGYGSSKAALDHASRILAAERPDVPVYVVDPGDMRTQMHQDAFPGEDISDRPEPDSVVPALLAVIRGDLPSGRHRLSDVPAPVDAGGAR